MQEPIVPAWAILGIFASGSLFVVPRQAIGQPNLIEPTLISPSPLSSEPAAAVTEITQVEMTPTETGLELVLKTRDGTVPVPSLRSEGNVAIAELSKAQLVLSEGDSIRQINPAPGVSQIQVLESENNRVQILVTGTDAAPQLSVGDVPGVMQLMVAIDPTDKSRSNNNDPDRNAQERAEESLPDAGQRPADELPIGNDLANDEAIEITVTANRDPGYNPSNSSTATGTDTPLQDVPLSVQVIPKAVIEDRNTQELGEALETVPGVARAGGRGTSVFGPGFLIRGFEVNDGIFRDGISTFSLSPLSTNDIERVEVLKGPASVLFGQGEPGGIINIVSKRPLDEPFYEISGTIGSFETYKSAVDLSGPLTADKAVKYRLNLSYENFGSFRDFVNGERLIVSPTLTWDINDKTSLDIFGQYAYNQETIDEGFPLSDNGIVNLPRSRFLNEDFGEFSQDEFRVGYHFKHRWDEDWEFRHSLQYLQYEPERFAPLFNDFVQLPGGDLERLEYFAGGTYRRLFTNAEVTGSVQTGSVKHQLLFGVEYRHDAENPSFQFDDLFASINAFNPVYTNVPFAIAPTFFRDDNVDSIGIYLQNQIELTPNLKLLAGIRYDTVDQFRTERELGSPRQVFKLSNDAFSPRLGIVYQPIEPISLYASYTSSFNPAFGASRNEDGSPFEPERGRQFEVGIKGDVSDRLSVTLAAFDIRKTNVATDNPNTPDPFDQIQTGAQTSRGIELFATGEILPGWNVNGGYTYLDAFVSQDNTIPVGNRLANAPTHQFSLWTTYEVQSGDLAGLGGGLGLFYVDDRQGDIDNTFVLPSYFRADAALFYKRDNWRVQLNLENLFNERYFTESNFGFSASPGAPFNVSGSVSFTF